MSVLDIILGGRGALLPGEALYRKSANPPLTNLYVGVLILAEVVTQVYLYKTPNGYDRSIAIAVGVVTMIMYAGYLATLLGRRDRRCLIAPDHLIFVFLVLFHLPGVFFEAIGWARQDAHFFYHYTHVNYAMVLDLSGIIGWLVGYNIFAKPPAYYLGKPMRPGEYSVGWIRLGQGLVLIGILFHLYFSFTQISILEMIKQRYTMSRFYSQDTDERFWFTGIFFVRTGFFVIAVGSAAIYGKMMKGWINWVVFWLYLGFIFVTGHRAVVALTLITPIVAYAYLIRPIKARTLITVALLGLFVMSVGVVVRQQDDKSVANVERALSENKKVGILTSVLEAGNSAKAMFRALAVWPGREGRYEYGWTFVQGILRGIPNLGPTAGALFRESESPAMKLIRITEPAAYRNGIGYGFTIIAEGYVNFGPWGPFFVLVFVGWCTRRLFDRAFFTRNPYRMILAVSWTLGMCNLVRNDAFSSTKPLLWAYGLLFVARLVFNSMASKNASGGPLMPNPQPSPVGPAPVAG